MATLGIIQPVRYRMRAERLGRFVIERRSSDQWESTNYVDTPLWAYRRLKELAHNTRGGLVVCSHCEQELQMPILRDGKVVCDRCILILDISDANRLPSLITGFALGSGLTLAIHFLMMAVR